MLGQRVGPAQPASGYEWRASQGVINELRESEELQLMQWDVLQPPRRGAAAAQVPEAPAVLARDVQEWQLQLTSELAKCFLSLQLRDSQPLLCLRIHWEVC